MNEEKNLQASIPQALLAKIQKAADLEHITIDQLVQDARNLTEEDVRDAIATVDSDDMVTFASFPLIPLGRGQT